MRYNCPQHASPEQVEILSRNKPGFEIRASDDVTTNKQLRFPRTCSCLPSYLALVSQDTIERWKRLKYTPPKLVVNFPNTVMPVY